MHMHIHAQVGPCRRPSVGAPLTEARRLTDGMRDPENMTGP